MSLKTNILQLLRRGTAAAPRQGSSLGTASPQAWECTFCTYLHSEEELDYLACKLCQAVRVEALASGEAPPGSLADPGPAPATAQSGAAAAPRKRKLAAADDTAPRAASAAAPRAASVAAHQAASAAAPRAASAAAPRAASAATPGRDAFADLMRAEARRSTKWAFRASRDAAGVLTADFVPEADGAAGRGRRVYSAPTRRLKVGTSFECQVSLSLDDASDGNDARWAPCAAAYDGAANAGGLSMLQSRGGAHRAAGTL
ncbi:hypothetical protein M885DRAFT_17546 [Pelagophyceae sp. CCMP2097]|nr:hypothetical protein M885DRAFT_17546 [Pelagophyceae sp. CCMP2097]